MGSPTASIGVLGSIMTLSVIKEFDSGFESKKEIKGLTGKTQHAQTPVTQKWKLCYTFNILGTGNAKVPF